MGEGYLFSCCCRRRGAAVVVIGVISDKNIWEMG